MLSRWGEGGQSGGGGARGSRSWGDEPLNEQLKYHGVVGGSRSLGGGGFRLWGGAAPLNEQADDVAEVRRGRTWGSSRAKNGPARSGGRGAGGGLRQRHLTRHLTRCWALAMMRSSADVRGLVTGA
jgi:hypothetical protein